MNSSQNYISSLYSNISLIQNPITIITFVSALFLIIILLIYAKFLKPQNEPKKLSDISLDTNSADITAIILKSTCKLAPVVGGFIGEIVGQLIPNQRINRVQQYSEILGKMFEELDETLLPILIANNNFIEFVEDSYYHAIRSATQKRMEQIAHIVFEGIKSRDTEFSERRHIFQILSQINDIEIIILGYFLYKKYGNSRKYQEKYPEIFEREYYDYPEDSDQRDKSAILESYYGHLTGLGLLVQNYSIDNKSVSDTKNRISLVNPNGLSISRSGKLLLRYLNIECEDVKEGDDEYVYYLMD